MKNKFLGICICMLLITTCIVPVYGAINESTVKKSSISPGDYLRFMFFGMRLRSYRIHVPPSYDGSNPMPLVVVLHGFASCAKAMLYVGMNEKADEEGFIALYPNGHTYKLEDHLWSLLYYGQWGFIYDTWDFDNVDDVGFIRTLIESLQKTLEINSSRMYVTGFSGGAGMTHRLGAELSDIIAAIAPVAGSIGGIFTDRYGHPLPLYIIPEPEHPLPVIIFHGMNDSSVPYNGGGSLSVLSVNESVAFWVVHNQCDSNPQIDISESGNIIKSTYANGSLGTEVVLYAVVDGEHRWFGAPDSPCEISATELIWEFFEAHPKQ